MKKFFWIGFLGLLAFEVMNVYFIMPMPGSQKSDSIDLAYFLYSWRWAIRILFGLMIVLGVFGARWKRRWLLIFPLALLFAVIYMANFKMAADHMFYQPKQLLMSNVANNKVDPERLVLGVVINEEAKAYPIQFLGYHHQVQDTIGGKPVIVTYCTVCRTGRVFEPLVDGSLEKFRLVGMDHFNAMFEDKSTKSWWRQETGEAITGRRKGHQLPEVFSTQTSLSQWLQHHPQSLIMQPDPASVGNYDTTFRYESGQSKSKLTGTDSLSWNDKSWVIGLKGNEERKAYDWNQLKKERIIHDRLGTIPVLLVVARDDKSFYAFQRPAEDSRFLLSNDTLIFNAHHFRLDGMGIDTASSLKPLPAYQEFWHSWKSFNPGTLKY